MQITVEVKQTVLAEIESTEFGYAISRYLLKTLLSPAEQQVWDDAGCDWYTDDAGHVCIGASASWQPFPASMETAALVDAMNVLRGHGLLKMPADPKPTLYEAYPAQCPNGHDGATYVPEIEAVRCPVCGLSDVSA